MRGIECRGLITIVSTQQKGEIKGWKTFDYSLVMDF